MRTWIGLALAATMLAGCGVEVLTTTAIQGELQAKQMQSMNNQLKSVANQTGRINIERAIQAYKAEKGSFPPSLDDLVPNYVPYVPKRADGALYGYDPATGTLMDSSVTAAATSTSAPAAGGGSTAEDQQTMQAIRDAINKYGTSTGYYPNTLDILYPSYLNKPPRTSSGGQFVYNNQNGDVKLPRQGGAAPSGTVVASPRSTAGGGGAGPMGEVMTGIAVQQQLDSNSGGGAASASGYARQSIGNTAGGHDAAQNQAMDQLGL